MKKIITRIRKYWGFVVPTIITIILLCLEPITKLYHFFDGNKLNTLVGISGSFLGALLASLSILLALPIDGTFKNLLNKYGHLKRLYIQIAFGSIFYMLSIVFWVFSSQNLFNSLSVIMFIQGLFHTLITFSTLIIILIENSRIIKSV